ncbi:MAG: CHAD domain-containing protein [Geodermatophilaceae bacterium]|nr:CHAD domain-containing protein [Geodermatophilaceae bacterium]
MSDASTYFVADDDKAHGFAPALAALAPRYSVRGSPAHTVRHTWLDTDDWRLHRAGMVLEQSEFGADDIRLTLRAAGQRQANDQLLDAIAWPSKSDAIPAGSVGSQIAGIVGIRALLPTATLQTNHQDLRVLNDDGKTVVRLTIESSVGAQGQRLADQLSVSGVPGYLDQAQRVASRFAAVPGIATTSVSIYERALQAAGRSFGDDRPKPVDMSASMPASDAVVAVLRGFLCTVQRTLDGVLADLDIEFLHDFRVAVRRARSTLKLAGDVLEPGAADQLGRDLKWLGDLTSPTRDLDVYLLEVPAVSSGLQSAQPGDLAPFRDHLVRRRRTEFRRLVRGLRTARFRHALDHWLSVGLSAEPSEPGHLPSAGALAVDRLRRAHRRVVKRGRAIGADSAAEDLHDLRKRAKELRYLLEIFGPLHDPATHRAALKDLKALQEVLGNFQDGQVQGQAVREFAASLMQKRSAPAATVLAMGELAAQLDVRQQHARSEFAARFAAFDSSASRRRFRKLASGSVG